MKYSLLLVCAASLVLAFLSEDGIGFSRSNFQIRQVDRLLSPPLSFGLRSHGTNTNSISQNRLRRRSGRSSGEERSRNQGSPKIPSNFAGQASPQSQSPSRANRAGSPLVKTSVLAEGPATLNAGSRENKRTKDVPVGQNDILHDNHPHFSTARVQSNRPPPPEGRKGPKQMLQAGAKGQSVMAVVKPNAGGHGRIRIETPDGTEETAVRGGEEKVESAGSNIPGGSRVMAKATRGGKITTMAVDQDNSSGAI